MAALTFNWLGRIGGRRRTARVLAPLVPSRDLPLPRSPEPMPDEVLVFAQQGAARRPLHVVAETVPEKDRAIMPASVATGADLRAMLERFERAHRRRQALSQAAQARTRLVDRLAAGKAGAEPSLRLVGAHAPLSPAQAAAEEEKRIDKAMDEALASALATLTRLSALARG